MCSAAAATRVPSVVGGNGYIRGFSESAARMVGGKRVCVCEALSSLFSCLTGVI